MKICARKSQRMHFRASRPLWLLGPLSGPQTPRLKGARSMSDRIERAASDYQDTLSAPKPNLDTLLSKSWLSPCREGLSGWTPMKNGDSHWQGPSPSMLQLNSGRPREAVIDVFMKTLHRVTIFLMNVRWVYD